ncbi:MAG: Gfo/Idh/MocA family oxidoreductase [Deinococcales bacterium]
MKKYALVGTGSRASMFISAIHDSFKDHAKLLALCDLSQIRMDWHNRQLLNKGHAAVATYKASDFDRMIAEQKPDVVIVCTMDASHHHYIIRAMELGCDVISEKPMTTDEHKAKAIFAAIKRTGKSLRVTFNYRYAPAYTKLREAIMQGLIGRPLSVNFMWLLDTSHGADYFRRWHREKENSGGLFVHKATHHFDLVNWWIDSYPKEVFAMGDLLFYGKDNATARGESYSYQRYTGIEELNKIPLPCI